MRAFGPSALLVGCLFFPLSTAMGHAEQLSPEEASCPILSSPLDAQALQVPRTYVRLSSDSIRDVDQSSAQRPDGATVSVAVNVRNACGGTIVLPDLTMLTIDPHALRGDRLVRVSRMISGAFLVELSPSDTHYPVSIPGSVKHQHLGHFDDTPIISMSYPEPGAEHPARLAQQVYMPSLSHHHNAVAMHQSQPTHIASAVMTSSVKPILVASTSNETNIALLQSPVSMPVPATSMPATLTPQPQTTSVPTPAPTVQATISQESVNETTGVRSITRNINATTGGSVFFVDGTGVVIGPGILSQDSAVTLSYDHKRTIPAHAVDNHPVPGVLVVLVGPVNPQYASADAQADVTDSETSKVIVHFHRDDDESRVRSGLAIMHVNYLAGTDLSQTEADVQGDPNEDVATFSGAVLSGIAHVTKATFAVEQFTAPGQ